VPDSDKPFDHVWFWRSRLPDRKGERCRVLATGALNSAMVEFEDGLVVITSRYAVRKVKQESSVQSKLFEGRTDARP
jgi:hypothetical protein